MIIIMEMEEEDSGEILLEVARDISIANPYVDEIKFHKDDKLIGGYYYNHGYYYSSDEDDISEAKLIELLNRD